MSPASGSVAVTVVTAVLFSATSSAAVAPPQFEVIAGGWFAGASFTSLTVTAIAWLSLSAPSETATVTS